MIRKLKAYFFTGLLVLTPLALTIYIIWKLFVGIDGILRGVVNEFLFRTIGVGLAERPIPGVGFVAVLLLILATGMVARNYVGRKLLNLGDSIVTKIPLINRLYQTLKQISQAFLSEKREVLKKVVLVEYPRKGIYSIGFFTQDTKGLVQDSLATDVVSVFLPTTPNPTSGYLLFVPKSEIIELDLSIEEALKLVISGGPVRRPTPSRTAPQATVEKGIQPQPTLVPVTEHPT